MKFSIEKSILLKSLSHVQSVVEKRQTMPILSNVLLKAEDGQLSLTATDKELTINETAPAEIDQGGTTTAPAHTFYDIVRKLPDGATVNVETDAEKNSLVIKCGRSKFSLASLPVDYFPVTSTENMPHRFKMATEELKNLIDRTYFAMSTEDIRKHLSGIYLHAAENNGVPVLRSVATDAHRLAQAEMPLPDGAAGIPGVIIPRKTVNELRKLLDTDAKEVELSLSDTQIYFKIGHTILTSKLIDGKFPDYEHYIPTETDKIMEIDCSIFTRAVDRIATISTEKNRAVRLALNGNNLVISANNPDSGTATEELEVNYGASPIEIGFNSKYLLDITQQISGDGAQFSMSDQNSPTIIKDPSDTSALYVLMPLRM